MENDIVKEVQTLLDKAVSIISNSSWSDKYIYALKNLQQELNAPCVLAVAGKVKAGKSFLVNSLLGIDVAMTGTTETTATVNIFKKGTPPSKDKPILCIYVDGSKEWITKDYLNSLQGTSDEALSRTSNIDRLIMYIDDNPLLDHVTLVDTPGIGAEVGDDGDSHQIHTDAYFKLRKKHQQQTLNLSNSADAIIYLFNTVPTETDKEFLASLYNDGNGMTSLNGIGVLAKVDKDITQVDNIPKFCKEFEHNLFSIIPTSATIEKYIPTLKEANEIKDILHRGFAEIRAIELALGSQTAFLHERLPLCMLTVSERQSLINRFAEKDLAWSSFALILKEIYTSDNLEKSIEKLKAIGGITNLREIIFKHFFNRSTLLRSNKVLEEIRLMLHDIMYDEKFVFAEDYAVMKDECMAECNKLSIKVKDIMLKLISEHLPSLNEVRTQKENIVKLHKWLEDIQCELRGVNNYYMAYQQIVANRGQFSNEEFDELCCLFSGQKVNIDAVTRYKYWTGVFNLSAPNSVRQQTAKIAKSKYLELID